MVRTWLSRMSKALRTPRRQARAHLRLRVETMESRIVPAPFPLSETFNLSSLPTATKTIYLDFNGHTTTGTLWNNTVTGGNPIVTPAYDINNNPGSFSTLELENIQEIWQRVTEDFAPFDVNVTTKEPDVELLRNTGGADVWWGIRVVIGGRAGGPGDWYPLPVGGIAYVNSFSWDSDTPTYVFSRNLNSPKSVADAVSHEVGHTLGLSHDGRDFPSSPDEQYYAGHGTGATGWGPIMGAPYTRNLTQWSKGEYQLADNQQDDLAIITGTNGFGYRADDHGNLPAGATPATVTSSTTIAGSGIIERNTDFDYFSFRAGVGTINIQVDPAAVGPNLDVVAELYDAFGNLLAVDNPVMRQVANQNRIHAILTANVPGGTYYLKVEGGGRGLQGSVGYSDYGSLGQYTFTGTVPADVPTDSLQVIGVDALENTGGAVTGFRLTFNIAPDPTTLLPNILVTGPTGRPVRVSAVRPVGETGTVYDVIIAGQRIPAPSATAAGGVRLYMSPAVLDTAGRFLDQDGDVNFGELADDFFAAATYQFNTTYTPATGAIADDFLAGTDFVLNVPDSPLNNRTLTIADLNVRVNITHPRVSDLKLELVSPLGTVIPLVNTGSLNRANLSNTRFDDEATQTLADGRGPYTGFYRPANPLAVLDGAGLGLGEDAVGDWTLRVTDSATGSVGRLNSWGLTVTTDDARDGLQLLNVVPINAAAPDVGPASTTRIVGLTLTFNQPVNPATLTRQMFRIIHSPTGRAVAVRSITPVPNTNNTQFTVGTDQFNRAGDYSILIGPSIIDLYGNGLDRDADGRQSQVLDAYSVVVNAPDEVITSGRVVNIPRPRPNQVGPVTVTSAMNVSADIFVSDVAVQLYLSHDDLSKLKITLIAPNGTSFILVNTGDGIGTLFNQTVFTNIGAATIAGAGGGDAPYRDDYQPVNAFGFPPNTPARGTWRLVIEDQGTSGLTNVAGQLLGWSLFVR